jgi:hypothetical protein
MVVVLMPFTKTLKKRYERTISVSFNIGMGAERVDKQSFHRQGITDKIIQQIPAG